MRTSKRALTALSTVAVLSAIGVCRMDSTASANPLPCSANTTLTVYVPSSSTHGTLMLEDQWPGYGDLDFNDAVITYQYAFAYNSAGNLTQLVATYNVLAAGNGRDNGFALALPIPKTNVGSVTLQKGNGAPSALSPRAAETNLVVDVLANTKSAFDAVGNGHQINTDPGQPVIPGTTYQVVITLSTPTALSAALAPFDAFFYWTETPGHEIHRPDFAGSAAMDAALFGTLQDGSTGARHFVDNRGIPYVLDVPQTPRWSQEAVDISSGYAQLAAFGQSGGVSNQTWYQSPTNAALFTSGQGGALPPSASFLGGSGEYSIDGQCNLCISNNVTCPAAPDQCHDQGTCAPATGVCSAAPSKADGTACNDGNAGTSNDVCTNGTCAGTAVPSCTTVNPTFVGTHTMETHSYGGGYSPFHHEYWYPEWSGWTVYRYNSNYQPLGSFVNQGEASIMQLWGDTDGSYYTAHWGANTIQKVSGLGGGVVWTVNLGNVAAGVTSDANYVYAMPVGTTVWKLNKSNGALIEQFNLSNASGAGVYGSLAVVANSLFRGGDNGVVEIFDLTTHQKTGQFNTGVTIFNMSFNGQDYCVSSTGNTVSCWQIATGCPQ